VAFAAVDVFTGVVAAAGLGDGLRGAYGLGVDDCRGRGCLPAFDEADLFAPGVVDAGDGAVAGPPGVVVVDGLPGREVAGQRPS
jgi:hypothetical protein